jgi:hypothetical protein
MTYGSHNNKYCFDLEAARVNPGPRCYPRNMTHHRYLVPLLLTVTLVACRSAGAPVTHAASLNQEIQLAPKEQAVFVQPQFNVEFVRVVEDSRCPSDVTCVWAGEVKVQVSTRINAAEAVQHEIKAGEHATVGGLHLVVVAVQPERLSTREISPDEYRVTLKVVQPSG